jgi:hypothetical protein
MIYELSSEKQGDLIAGNGIAITPSGTSATIEVTGRANLKLSNIDTQLYPSSITSTSGWGVLGSPDVVVDYWIAQDGSGWYRKYRSGWVEQGVKCRWPNSSYNNNHPIEKTLFNYIYRKAPTILYSNIDGKFDTGVSHSVDTSSITFNSSWYATCEYAFVYAAGIGDIPANYKKYSITIYPSKDTYVTDEDYFIHDLSSDSLNLPNMSEMTINLISLTGVGIKQFYGFHSGWVTIPTESYQNNTYAMDNIAFPQTGTYAWYTNNDSGYGEHQEFKFIMTIKKIENNHLYYSLSCSWHNYNGSNGSDNYYNMTYTTYKDFFDVSSIINGTYLP